MSIKFTIDPVKPAALSSAKPEFARTRDVEVNYGLKRGTLYNLHADGKIRGYLLRVRGQKSGVRLWDLESIDQLIRSQETVPDAGSANGSARPASFGNRFEDDSNYQVKQEHSHRGVKARQNAPRPQTKTHKKQTT